MGRKDWFYRVEFKEPPIEGDGRTEFYFSSLAAIYEQFAPEQVGCKVARLWNVGVSDGVPYRGRKCSITRERIKSKTQNRARISHENTSGDKLHICDEKIENSG